MNEFLKFYKWGIEVKLYMAIYTVALLCAKCVFELLSGNVSVNIIIIFEMLIVCFAASLLQRACFPAYTEFERKSLINHTSLWAILTNVLFIGASVLLGWFPGIPFWGIAVLLILLEISLAAMWVAFYIVQKIDTQKLNDRLTAYQQK